MADPRTFVLIGDFQDNITPALESINATINSFKRNMASMSTKRGGGFNDVTQSVGKLVSAQKHLKEAIEGVGAAAKSATQDLKEYKNVMGKVSSAQYHIQKSGTAAGKAQSKFWEAANKDLDEYKRKMEALQRQTRISPYRSLNAPGGRRTTSTSTTMARGGGYTPPLREPRTNRTDGFRGGVGAHMAEFGFAYTLGTALSQPIQNAIVSGFQIGVSLMVKPFQYFADRLKERIEDEQSDIKAAGGIFSISRRQKDPFVKTMDEAMEFTQENNKRMAELAAALPGNTQQYIEVSKRISDSISRIVTSDKDRAVQYANELRAERGATQLEGTGGKAVKSAITELLGEMTKKTVLAGLGTGGGPGGVAGAYGLPQLTERMLTQQEVSMGQFQRYAAIFKDPLIMEALNRFIPKINASAAGTLERFKVMQQFYDEVLPPEMIRKFERSTAGILELFNTTIFGPETGLFGLGRKMEGMGKVMDDYGNYIKVFEDGTRKVVGSLEEASDANLSLFDMLRDSFANLGIALYPILSNLGSIFDPINKVAKLLVDFRHATGRFLNAFESYKKGFEDMVKDMDDIQKSEFLKIGLDLRASLAAVNNFFANQGIIDEAQFQKNAKQLMSTTFDYKAMMSGMLDTFLNSDVAGKLGELVGEIIGTVLTEVAKVTGFLSGRVQSSNKLFEGLKKGFEEAGGPAAIRNIFKDVFSSLLKILGEVMQVIPFEGYLLIAAMTVIPAAVQGLGMLLAEKTLGAILRLYKFVGKTLDTSFAKTGATVAKGAAAAAPLAAVAGTVGKPGAAKSVAFRPVGVPPKGFEHVALPGKAPSIVGGVTSPGKAPEIPKPAKSLARTEFGALAKLKGKGVGLIASGMIALSTQAPALAKAGKSVMSMAKSLPGLNIALGALDFGLRKAAGESTGVAAGGAAGGIAGGIAGGTLGSALGPAGTVIGSVLGSMIGSWVGENIAPIFEKIKAAIQSKWAEFTAWASSGFNVGKTIGQVVANLQNAVDGIGIWFQSLPGKFSNWVAQFKVDVGKAFTKMAQVLSNPTEWGKLWTAFTTGFTAWIDRVKNSIGTWFKGLAAGFQAGYNEARKSPGEDSGGGGKAGYLTRDGVRGWMSTSGEWTPLAKGGLGDAIASEMRMKPPGSDLVIANSSETVIPAAGGYGMKDFMGILSTGFTAINNQYKSLATGINTLEQSTDTKLQRSETQNADRYQKTTSTINNYHKENQQEFSKIGENILQLSQKVASMSSMGGMFGGGMELGGGYGSAGVKIAGALGNFIKQTGGAPGSIHEHPMHGGVKGKHAPGSYHYSGRAIDIGAYANEQAGVIARIQQFNAKYGVKPVEFLHAGNDPNHQDHVHVAYAMGLGNPILAPTRKMAQEIDARALGRANIETYTAGKGEFGGGSIGTLNVTVNAGNISDPDILADVVAQRILSEMQSDSIFV